MTPKVSWSQALAWRMRRHFLDPVGSVAVSEVVRRLCGVQAQVASSAELAVRVRQERSDVGEVARALGAGDLIRTWAMRGALHLLTPEAGGAFLSLMAAGRSWERPSWQRYFGVSPAQIEALRGAVREALAGRTLTREELIAAVVQQPGFEHLGHALRSGWGTLLKPLAWQGDLCHGPYRGARVTFRLPRDASPRWAGVPEPDIAAPIALAAYLGAYGPTTGAAFGTWLAGGWFGQRRIDAWVRDLGDRVALVDLEGERAYVLAEDLDELAASQASVAVRLLPGFDQWVLGPGTADGHVVPTSRRAAVSKQSGWIAPVALVGGLVSGTWELDGDRLRVAWFGEAGRPPRAALWAQVERWAALLGRDVSLEIGAA